MAVRSISTVYYDPAKEENARARVQRRRAGLFDLDGVDGVLPRRPGAQLGTCSAPVRQLLPRTAFEAAAAAGVRVVFASSSSVYGEAESYPTSEDATPQPISPYGITKLGCEQLARAYAVGFGLDAVALRYFTVYGPRQRPDMFFRRVCDALLEGGSFEIYGSGAQSRSFTEVGDAVDATISAMERAPAGALYNVGGGDEASMLEAIALLEQISGRTLEVAHVGAAKGDVRRTKADVTRIREALGWEPRTSLADGLARMWAWAAR